MKKIIILGAGIYQVPLIRKAKQLGLYTIVISIKGNYPGFQYADKVYYKSTVDSIAILEIAKNEGVSAICTAGTDVAIGTIGLVCEALNLPGIHKLPSLRTTDKLIMKEAFDAYGVRSAKHRKVSSIAEAEKCFSIMRRPLMFKAVDSSGSRGVIKVDNAGEIEKAYEYAFKATKKNYIVVEEYLEGVEFGAQSAVVNGKTTFIMPHGDIVFNGKTDVPIGHYVPYNVSEEVLEDIKEQIKRTITALELDNCALNFDFILKDQKVYVLEVGARVGATCLAEQVSLYYDIDYYEYLIKMALGEKLEDNFVSKTPNASLLFISKKSGEFTSIELNEDLYKIVEKKYDYLKGDYINEFKVGPDRIGHVIIKEDSLEILLKKINHLQNNYSVIVN